MIVYSAGFASSQDNYFSFGSWAAIADADPIVVKSIDSKANTGKPQGLFAFEAIRKALSAHPYLFTPSWAITF